MISCSGLIKVADFGLALNSMASDALTKTNALLGSVQFMSPEQRNDPTTVDIPSDIYSVAQTLVWLVHGRTLGDLYVSATLTKLQETLPLELVDIIKRAGQLNPQARYESVQKMIQALERIEVSTESQKNLLFGLELQEISIDDLHPSNTPTLPEVNSTQPASVEMVIPNSLYGLLGVLTISVAAWAALRSAIPGTPRRGAAYMAVALFVAWFTLYGVGFVSPALDTGMLGKRDHCVFESLILGIPDMGLGWSMLQRLYPLRPLQTAAALGLAAGLAPGLYMQLGCMYDPGHALAFHYAPGVAAAAIFAGLYSFVRGRASIRPM